MADYYNEIDPFAAAWLRELMKAGQIPDGEVDERSIELVHPDDVRGFRQCHFFAGIGGWAYALRLANWPDDRGVWTGSCPCQPWSVAGQGAGAGDSRDLWPAWFELIRECAPTVVFGEQVAGKAGRAWLDRVYDDLEASNYAVAPFDLPAASVGAFHRRHRLWFVADAVCQSSERRTGGVSRAQATIGGPRRHDGCGADGFADGGEARDVADAEGWRCRQGGSDAARCDERTESEGTRMRPADNSGGMVNAGSMVRRPSRHDETWDSAERIEAASQFERSGFWDDVEWLPCLDGRTRPTQPGLCPLAHGVLARVGRLRGYGNAIVPQVAQVFIESYLDVRRG